MNDGSSRKEGLNRQRAFLTYWILYCCIHSSWVNMHILDPGEASSPPLQVLLGKISRPSHMHSTNMQGQPLHAPWYSPPKGRKIKPPAEFTESASCLHALWKPCTGLQSSIYDWPRNLLKRGMTWTPKSTRTEADMRCKWFYRLKISQSCELQ